MGGRLVIGVCVALATSATNANARPASSGWYAEGGLGAMAFLPKHADDAALGPAIDIRIGRDLFSWLSLGISVGASSHEATVMPPPEGEWFQLYRGGGHLRIGGRFDRIALFIEAGVGIGLISSNILDKVMVTEPGETFSLAVSGGAGFEYQLENRHYALGLAVDTFLLPQFDAVKALDTRFYLRYTY